MALSYGLVTHKNLAPDELEKVKGFPEPDGNPSLSIVVGGDGLLLREFHENPDGKKLLVCKNESRGFYKAIDLKDVDGGFWQRLEKGEYKTVRLPVLEVELSSRGKKDAFYALNDVAIRGRTNDRTYRFEVATDGHESVNLKGDGLIVATPQGSPAYNKSAGGPVIELCDSYLVTSLACREPYSKMVGGKRETRIAAHGRMQVAIDGGNPFLELEEEGDVEFMVKLSEEKYVELVTFGDFSVLGRARTLWRP